MFSGIDHVVISVKDMTESLAKYQAIFGREVSRTGEPPGAGFLTAHFDFEPTTVELVQPTDETGPVARHLERTGGGVYLMAMAVADIDATLVDLRAKGVRLIGDPGEGNPVKGQVFVHPSETGGVLMQLVPTG
ncbi:MAG: VOC family protein [Chloroflexi bacterium]|nr:VOC family protein [Chloroflexota bacterium]MDA1146858.1 VOC family protein [Chloroflexota bacterium]